MTEQALASDGYPLAINRFPAAGAPLATLLVAGAMGVRQDFYAPIARYFAGNGIGALTFDYRGMGFSRSGNLRGFEADVTTWAERDFNAMLSEAQALAPSAPLVLLGHSLGGQLLGVLRDNARVRVALNVTAGSGYYRFNDRMPAQVRIFWFGAIPLLTPLFGYFPGKAIRMVGDLPRGVAWQWRKWCLHPEYLLCEGEAWRAAFDRVRIPIRSYSFEDDHIVTRRAIDHLSSFYRAAAVERRHVEPREIGARRIGHFGFFSEKSRDTLWRESLDWLKGRLKS